MSTNRHKIAFTVDVEDWYQGIELPISSWPKYEKRIEIGLNIILNLLIKHEVKATFFILGWVAEKYPALVKQIYNEGHEIGSHGYSHTKVYQLNPTTFKEEISRTKKTIEDITGTEVLAYRAPFFSITENSQWALPILAETGHEIDASLTAVKTWRYGVKNCPAHIFQFKNSGLIEFPVSSFSFIAKKWAIGGAYFRLFPYWFSHSKISKHLAKNEYAMFYIHPWEYDVQHPKIKLKSKLGAFTHYVKLKNTFEYTNLLLSNFNCTTMQDILENERKKYEIIVLDEQHIFS